MERQMNQPARLVGKFGMLAMALLVASCITVNVNFPESAVQRAADDFVRDLYKAPQVADAKSAVDSSKEAAAVKSDVKKGTKKKKNSKPAETLPNAQKDSTKPTGWNFELFTAAYAQEINTNTPKANEIRERMKTRVASIAAWKAKGALCETDDGMLSIINSQKPADQSIELAKLVKAENKDRDELYEEIQSANRISDHKQTKIRKFFSAAFRQAGPPACK